MIFRLLDTILGIRRIKDAGLIRCLGALKVHVGSLRGSGVVGT